MVNQIKNLILFALVIPSMASANIDLILALKHKDSGNVIYLLGDYHPSFDQEQQKFLRTALIDLEQEHPLIVVESSSSEMATQIDKPLNDIITFCTTNKENIPKDFLNVVTKIPMKTEKTLEVIARSSLKNIRLFEPRNKFLFVINRLFVINFCDQLLKKLPKKLLPSLEKLKDDAFSSIESSYPEILQTGCCVDVFNFLFPGISYLRRVQSLLEMIANDGTTLIEDVCQTIEKTSHPNSSYLTSSLWSNHIETLENQKSRLWAQNNFDVAVTTITIFDAAMLKFLYNQKLPKKTLLFTGIFHTLTLANYLSLLDWEVIYNSRVSFPAGKKDFSLRDLFANIDELSQAIPITDFGVLKHLPNN